MCYDFLAGRIGSGRFASASGERDDKAKPEPKGISAWSTSSDMSEGLIRASQNMII